MLSLGVDFAKERNQRVIFLVNEICPF